MLDFNSRTKVMVVEDHDVLRMALTISLETCGFEVVGEARSAEQAFALAIENLPDVVLLDIQLPGMNGIDATRRLKSMLPSIGVIVMTIDEFGYGCAYDDPIGDALLAGADGYFVKTSGEDALMEAICTVSAGRVWMDKSLFNCLPQAAADDLALQQKTREAEVFNRIAQSIIAAQENHHPNSIP